MAATIVTYGGIEVLEPLFTSVARILGTNVYTSLLEFFTMIGFVWAITMSVQKNQVLISIRWFAMFIGVYLILFIPRTTVAIEDRVNGQIAVVDKVPIGLAVFASISSQIGDVVTELLEEHFSTPDDLKYSRNGMLMASRLVEANSKMSIHDAKFDSSLKSFVSQCVFYDLLLGKYTIQDLYSTNNLWQFMSRNASPARAFKYHNTIMTCSDGAVNIENDWQRVLEQTSTIYGFRLFGGLENQAKAKLGKLLPISYQYLTGLSNSASQIMQQNLLANVIDEAIMQQGAVVNSDAAVESYAVARAELMKRSAYQVTGRLAGYWLPIMKNIYEALFYGSFVLIMLLIVLPVGGGILRSYVFSLFWLQSWAPLNAILNLVINVYARNQSQIVAAKGLSLSAQAGLFDVNADSVALAGYLTMSIPFIAYGLVKGGASVFTQLATHIGNVGQSVATKAAEEATTGNFGFGNTQFANHSAFNTNAYHLNTSPQYSTGQASYTLADGATVYHNADGSNVIESRTALSSTAIGLQSGESFRNAINTQYEHAMSAGLSQVTGETMATASSLNSIHEYAQSQGNLEANDITTGYSQGSSINNSLQQIDQLIERFAHNNNLTTSQATKILAEAMAGLNVELGQFVKFSGKVHTDIQGLSSAENAQVWQHAEEFIKTTNFSQNYEDISRVIHDSHIKTGQDSTQRLIDNISAKHDESVNFRNEASAQLNKIDSLRELSNISQEEMVGVTQNYNQEFSQWLPNQIGHDGRKIGLLGAEYIQNHQPQVAGEYANQFMNEKVRSMLDSSDAHHTNNSDIMNKFDKYDSHLGSQNKVEEVGIYNRARIDIAEDVAEFEPFAQNAQVENKAKQLEQRVDQAISTKAPNDSEDAQRIKGHAERRTDPSRHDTPTLARKKAWRSIKSIKDF